MVLTLYKLDGSPPVRSVFMVIEALNLLDVAYVDVNLLEGEHLKEEYVKINPQHTVPMLKDGNFTIWDSHAIATYLVSKYGEDDPLYPKDLEKRAVIDQRLHFDSGILFPAVRGTVEPVLFFGEKAFRPENLAKIQKAYELTEKFLTSPWLSGDAITLADICCVSTISTMHEITPIDANFHAIATYLVSKYGEDDSLYPKDLEKRAIIDQRLHFDSGILFPASRGTVEPVLFFGEKAFRPENLAKIQKAYELTEKFLTSPWLTGDAITLSDICCVSTISTLNEITPIDANLYPNLADWLNRCSQQEFYKKGNESGLEQFRGLIKSKVG